MKHINEFQNLSQPEEETREITISFQVPDVHNQPGYWESYEGEPFITYRGPKISDRDFLENLANSNGELGPDYQVDEEILEALGDLFGLQDLAECASRANGDLETFSTLASEALFKAFEGELMNCADILDDGEDTIPEFMEYYTVEVQ